MLSYRTVQYLLWSIGRRKLLQCVLDIREILNACEPYYVLNNLYITDYIIWLQRARYCVYIVTLCVV